jgi:hypothetical protein
MNPALWQTKNRGKLTVVIAVDEKMPREKTVEARCCYGDWGWLGCDDKLESHFPDFDLNQRIMQFGVAERSLPGDIWHQFLRGDLEFH